MFFHELRDAVLVGLDHSTHLRADLRIASPADLRVPHDALAQIGVEEAGPKHLGHGPGGAAIVFQQFLQPVFRLRVAGGKRRVFERRGEDVRDAKLVAINRRRQIGRPCGREGDRHGHD